MTAAARPPAVLAPVDLPQFKERAQALRLMGLLAHWDAVQGDPARIAWTGELLAWEEAERARRSLERRLRAAHIGRFKPLADFDWEWPKSCDRAAVQEYASGQPTLNLHSWSRMLVSTHNCVDTWTQSRPSPMWQGRPSEAGAGTLTSSRPG